MSPLAWGLMLFTVDLLAGLRSGAKMRGGMFTLWFLSLVAIVIAALALSVK